MEVGEKFLEFLDANPKASVNVFEGDKTKSMVFDGGAIIVQVGDLTFVRIGNEVFETHVSFYDKIFNLLQQNPLAS
ncbi:hypothetical protein [Acinetobacter sp. SWBY1]|uniref:hypothetical protein n=1 Tax=Acinetobacter sp. SWBY1 TaxID=2079596 RepID=UPI000CF2DFA9|nr:hypothetical protein [Acinetobacter sp. SWBY1]AVH49011.1 hypothetical protein C3Y93_04885 [Acinetobacter sp. SWBY1]